MLHNRIQLFRTERGLSRKDLAERVAINPQTVGFLERGDYRPTVELALKLAQVFEVRVEALFALEPFPSLADQLSELPSAKGQNR
jgi:DNA-binding XRE family transcriptional regulator